MNLYRLLQARADEGRPVRIGVIGAGKFSSMFLSQARLTPACSWWGLQTSTRIKRDTPV